MPDASLFRKKSIEKLKSDAARGELADTELSSTGMHKTLGTLDLTSLGIAAVIGAGIFSTIGNASFDGGPAVVFLFAFTAIACGFSVLCYAEFASMIPVSGSAYTYAYASFGELIAWIIGWGLIMEYAVGNIVVAISWSDYFTELLRSYHLHFPEYLAMDFVTASQHGLKVTELLSGGLSLTQIDSSPDYAYLMKGYTAWSSAPALGNVKLICDLPAFLITVIITTVVYIGIRESRKATNAMVALKIAIVLLVIAVGAFYIRPENWSPFMPNGVGGVLKGVSGVFFAYIGFDAISTTAEECKNPQRDLPRGMMFSLAICTVLYMLIALVLTGMMNYKLLKVGDPLAFVFGPDGANVGWISGIIGISAVIAMASVLLVFQLGQPRIWMAMSRDGLLPKAFSTIHPRFKTPSFSTIITGLVVGIPALFVNMSVVLDLTSIGTLFAFLLVSGGVLVLQKTHPEIERKFKIPYVNSQVIIPILVAGGWGATLYFNPDSFQDFFTLPSSSTAVALEALMQKIPTAIYFIGTLAIAALAFIHRLSLIPVLALLSCGYLICGISNWSWFLLWLALGLVIYFFYGYKHSKLGTAA
jgi:basic amino acid/polyamine antiporter, APA family